MREYFLWVRRNKIFITVHIGSLLFESSEVLFVEKSFVKFVSGGYIRVVPFSAIDYISEGK
jgi:hypothetical protein